MCQGMKRCCPRAIGVNFGIGGDFINHDGTGSFSIYGDKFTVSFYEDRHPLVIRLYISGRELYREA